MNLDRTFEQINTLLNNLWAGFYAPTSDLDQAESDILAVQAEVDDLETKVSTQTIAFNAEVKLDAQYRTEHNVAGAIAYTLNAVTDNTLGKRTDHLVADGINEPTFSAEFNIAWGNYKNENGVENRLYFEPGKLGKIDVYITYKT